jgi:hypothetical protein
MALRLLLRLHQERLHVGQHEADVERARAVNVANPAGAVDEKDAELTGQYSQMKS